MVIDGGHIFHASKQAAGDPENLYTASIDNELTMWRNSDVPRMDYYARELFLMQSHFFCIVFVHDILMITHIDICGFASC